MAQVLVVDDDKVVLRAVKEILTRDGHQVMAFSDPVEALAAATDPSLDVVVSDIRMPNLGGIELLRAFKEAQPELEVIMMTGHATVETALQAVRAGAYDYLTKPFEQIGDFSLVVTRAIEKRNLKRRAERAEAALATRDEFEGIIGQSAQMQAVFKLVETVGPATATVLVQGESGTGKELVAKALHMKSPRRAKAFVAVNCSALTDTLLDSELFGHVKGAFTGALGNKKGLFEAADGGTLFLDEIGDIPAATQVRLLRALQEGEIKRVGGTEAIHVDVRVIAATNVDLLKARQEGRFREDLYYRLNVISIQLPPLRERPTDVPLLAAFFVKRYAAKMGRKIDGISRDAVELLIGYRWPGNVRELENAIERAVVLSPEPTIGVEGLPAEIRTTSRAPSGEADVQVLGHLPFAQAKALMVAAFERRYLSQTLERAGNNVTQAAIAAGMDRSNFRRLLKEHGLSGKTEADPPAGT